MSSYAAALAAVKEATYDVCLVDYRLGAEDGIALVRELVADGFDTPILVLTGLGDRAVDIEATRAGAADYLVKGEVTPALLERTIRYAMRRHADMRALRDSEEGLRQGQRMEAVGPLRRRRRARLQQHDVGGRRASARSCSTRSPRTIRCAATSRRSSSPASARAA